MMTLWATLVLAISVSTVASTITESNVTTVEVIDEYANMLNFRVEKFDKSYSVVEQEDLKIECKGRIGC